MSFAYNEACWVSFGRWPRQPEIAEMMCKVAASPIHQKSASRRWRESKLWPDGGRKAALLKTTKKSASAP
jgi:hypothetical protein